jgi:cysteine-rich repeat protein
VITTGEGCDDGNKKDGDGCSSGCAVEPGWNCQGTPSVCTAICGDGLAVGPEQCDDGNTLAGDGCSPSCAFEATCGNGAIEPGESCDDTNTASGDGCSATCQLEAGSVCGDSVDLSDPTKVTVAGRVTIYQGTTLGAANTTFGDPPKCSAGTSAVPRVVHRYRVGKHPAVLTVSTESVSGSALLDTVVWAYRDCLHPSLQLACGEDGGSATLLGALSTGYLPAGAEVFFVVSGYSALDVGAYQLRITEAPVTYAATSGTCAAPTAAGPGTWAGLTMGTGAHSGSASTACGAEAPDAVYAVTLAKKGDITARAATNYGGYDLVVSLLSAPCASGNELACADRDGAGSPESIAAKDLDPGTYYVVVGGYAAAADYGPYSLSIDTVEVLAAGAACSAADPTKRCATGTYCHAGTCAAPTDLLAADFSVDLSPFTVGDFASDGKSWSYCDPVAGCAYDNTAGATLSDPFALVADAQNVSMHGETMVSPALNASALTEVHVEFDHAFTHGLGTSDLASVDVSTDGTTWMTAASYIADAAGHVSVDISAAAAGHASLQIRFRYDDQTTGTGDSWAGDWRVDNVHVYGF